MKIFAIDKNYINDNKTGLKSLSLGREPVVFIKPDSALLKDHKPFFIPDHLGEIRYECELVVRISRLGKTISQRFAHRYYDALTLGIDFTAYDLQQELSARGLPWELAKGFDGSAVIGDWIAKDKFLDISRLQFQLNVNSTTAQSGAFAEMLYTVDELISYISQFFTLKTGDILYTGCPCIAQPIKINDHIEGYLEERKVLDFNCK